VVRADAVDRKIGNETRWCHDRSVANYAVPLAQLSASLPLRCQK
jgi:hypothetical protein